MAIHIVLDLFLEASCLFDLVDLGFLEELQVLEHKSADDLADSLMFVRASLTFILLVLVNFWLFISGS